jgi:WD40 repeat protein
VGHSGEVTAVAFTPDGQWLLSAGADRTVRLWSVREARLVNTLRLDYRIKHFAFGTARHIFVAGERGPSVLVIAENSSVSETSISQDSS